MKKIVCSIVIFIFLSNGFSFAEYLKEPKNDLLVSTSDDDMGLMNSDWPMFGHDLHHTGRSPYALDGNLPVLKWKFHPNQGSTDPIYGSPVIDNNGAIYYGCLSAFDNFFALNPDGSLKWRTKVNNAGNAFETSPALASDGTIYVGAWDHNFYALNPNGTLKWRYNTGNKYILSSPSIADDGTIYFSADKTLFALHSNGTRKWRYNAGGTVVSSPAIDENGIIYFGSLDSYLYALYTNGTLKWKLEVAHDPITAAPAIADDGTIYITSWDHRINAVSPNGTLKWKFSTDASIQEAPAIGNDGTIYVATYEGSLYAINPDGTLKWKDQNLADDSIMASPVLDANGVIYFGAIDDCFYAVNPDGSLRWKIQTTDYIEGPAAISSDGVIYFGNWYGDLFAYKTIQNDKPSTPEIQGPQTGKSREEYTFQFRTYDPEDDNVMYWIDWGDNTESEWIGPFYSGEWVNLSHLWNKQGDYSIRVKAMDYHPYVNPICRETEFIDHNIVLSKSKNFIDHIKDIVEFILSFFNYENLKLIGFP